MKAQDVNSSRVQFQSQFLVPACHPGHTSVVHAARSGASPLPIAGLEGRPGPPGPAGPSPACEPPRDLLIAGGAVCTCKPITVLFS